MNSGAYREGLEAFRAQIARKREAAAEAFAELQAKLRPAHRVVLEPGLDEKLARLDADASALAAAACAETDLQKLVDLERELDLVIEAYGTTFARAQAALAELPPVTPSAPPSSDLMTPEWIANALSKALGVPVSTDDWTARAVVDHGGRDIHLLAARCQVPKMPSGSPFSDDRPEVMSFHSVTAAVPLRLAAVDVALQTDLGSVIARFTKPPLPHAPTFHRVYRISGDLEVARACLTTDVAEGLQELATFAPHLQLGRGRVVISWIRDLDATERFLRVVRALLDALSPTPS